MTSQTTYWSPAAPNFTPGITTQFSGDFTSVNADGTICLFEGTGLNVQGLYQFQVIGDQRAQCVLLSIGGTSNELASNCGTLNILGNSSYTQGTGSQQVVLTNFRLCWDGGANTSPYLLADVGNRNGSAVTIFGGSFVQNESSFNWFPASFNAPVTIIQNNGSNLALGQLVNMTSYNDSGAYSAINTVIPTDNTIPQNTEGTQILSASYTARNAANILLIKASANFNVSDVANNTAALALFVGAGASAVTTAYNSGIIASTCELSYQAVVGTTSAVTYALRAGIQNAASTLEINGIGGQLYGSTAYTNMTIYEFKPIQTGF
ncbi:MAG: hypothetical protein KGZ39_00235 [Simkania sp.]|nr:hypothetical protein [Simkania sp.]